MPERGGGEMLEKTTTPSFLVHGVRSICIARQRERCRRVCFKSFKAQQLTPGSVES